MNLDREVGEIRSDMKAIRCVSERTERWLIAQDKRIKSLEESRANARGALWVTGGLSAAFASIVGWLFERG